jgi:hypothetical protein
MSDNERRTERTIDVPALKQKTLLRAAEILGGVERLSVYLGVPRADLLAWMAGNGEPPLPTFLLAVDVVLEDSEAYGLGAPPKEKRGENVEK